MFLNLLINCKCLGGVNNVKFPHNERNDFNKNSIFEVKFVYYPRKCINIVILFV